MQFETEGGAMGTTVISQISAGRTNRLWLDVDAAEESLAFDCITAFISDAYVSIRQGEPVDVPAREPMEVAP